MRLMVTIILSSIIVSCAPDKENDPNSPTPEADARDKYIGYWNATEQSAVAGANTHTVNIVKSSSFSSQIEINNFSGLSVSARATVNNNIITIPSQQIGSLGYAQGSGTLTSANNISLTYTTTLSSGRDSCTTSYTK